MIKFDDKLKFYIPTYISWQNMFGKTYIINEVTQIIVTLKGQLSLIWNCLNENLNYSQFIKQKELSKIDNEYLEEVLKSFVSSNILGVE